MLVNGNIDGFGLSLDQVPKGWDKSKVRFLIEMPHHIEEREPEGNVFEGTYVDVETTGLNHEEDEITSLGFIRFQFDDAFKITKIVKTARYFNEVSKPLTEENKRLTGLTDEILKGHRITDEHFEEAFGNSELVVAHNAKFDRKFIDKYYGKKMIWGCTNDDLDLRTKLFIPSNSLGVLMAYIRGFYFGHHDALEDCWAGVHLLDTDDFLKKLLDKVYTPEFRVYAWNSKFESKDFLKLRGYRWDQNGKVWWKGGFTQQEASDEIDEIIEYTGGEPETESIDIYGRFA